MSKTLEITLSGAQQVIPINDSEILFEAKVMVTSKSGEPFSAVIIDAESLNKLGEKQQPKFQIAEKGVISATIRNDVNKSDIWYLLLKSAKENQVSVQISVSPIAETYTPPPQADEAAVLSASHQDGVQSQPLKKKKKFSWIIIILIVIGIGVLGYFLYTKFFKPKSSSAAPPIDIQPATLAAAPTVSEAVEQPSVEGVKTDDLLARIDSLPDL
jgi:hypothetical protein